MSELILSTEEQVLILTVDGVALDLSVEAIELSLGPILPQPTGWTYSEQSSALASVTVLESTVYLRLVDVGQTATLPLVADVPDGWMIDIKDCGYAATESVPHTIVPSGSDFIADVSADDGSLLIDFIGGSMRLRAIHSISTWERVG